VEQEEGIVEIKPIDPVPDQISISYGIQWTSTVIEFFMNQKEAVEAMELAGIDPKSPERVHIVRLEERRTWIE
jgi:hypothetical protein